MHDGELGFPSHHYRGGRLQGDVPSLLIFEPEPLLADHRIHEGRRLQDRDLGAMPARSRGPAYLARTGIGS